ncbi:mobilization protein [Pararobbsia silviterrae]|uniref:Mobilization protein n=1 Tax=Pararobbsia silviterrae TaxID=1792498 RepID=A0A494X6B5_9BURK|nr:mobilization protein [Pararobbsia silviterrae]RKP46198.1 mobilization protein [Pararobbsia silviterrae]
MSIVHLIGGEKGGVGKSLVARVLAQYFIDRNLPFVGFDTDRSHGALLRYYGEFAAPAVLDGHDSLDPVLEAAIEQPDRRILVDLAAQTQQSVSKWFDDADVLGVAHESGVTFTWWHVMDAGRDSVDLLRQWLDQFGETMRLIIVLNEIRGERFELLEASGERQRAEALGAAFVSLRHLPDTTMQKIDQNSLSFWAAAHHPDRASVGLGMLERQRVKVWLSRAYEQIDKVAP